jgi:hypothetical protein
VHPPSMDRGALPFINAQKMVEISKEKVCFDLEMMVFLLPYDLGIMKNVFDGFKGWRTPRKVNVTLIKVHTTLVTVNATLTKVHTSLCTTLATLRVR